jgi:hypothetical protein
MIKEQTKAMEEMIAALTKNHTRQMETLIKSTTDTIKEMCENILCGCLNDGDLVFVILKGIYGFKFPKRFLEISSRDLTSSSFLLQLI